MDEPIPVGDGQANLAARVDALAARLPQKRAVVCPAKGSGAPWQHYTFAEFRRRMDTFAHNLDRIGVQREMRTVLLVRPGLDFLPLTFALLKLGAVPVLIDPGMGKKNLLRCVERSAPEAFLGIGLAHLARLLNRKYFRTVRIPITTGRKWGWGGFDGRDLERPAPGPVVCATTRADDLAAIVFTTGSTGPPKGVEYQHGTFEAQCRLLHQAFAVGEDDVDLAGFALFGIFSLALGATVVIPEMDPTRPAKADPVKILAAVNDHQTTFSFGSPALWNVVTEHCVRAGETLPSLSRVTMAGAPVPAYLHERLYGGLLGPEAEVHTPYGATESLPVTSITGREVLAETAALTRQGKGTCVGRPLPGVQLRVIPVCDDPFARWEGIEPLGPGEIGEIVVQGPNVSRRYFRLPEATARHKIYETDDTEHGPFWHRIGDLGYLDVQGRLWFCGRQGHRVVTATGTLYTVCCEAIFNEHPRVYRSALVGLGERPRQTPVMIVEPAKGAFPERAGNRRKFRQELRELGRANPLTDGIERILFHPSFPVDIRHNAKIFREKLRLWAANARD